MSLNMKTLSQAFAKTAAAIEKTVQTTVQDVTGPKALHDYDLLDQIGSAGPGLAWKLYSGKARNGSSISQQYPTVCVWLLDKRALAEARVRVGLSKAAEDSFLDVIRADAARLVRLRHPGVLHVVQALDESKNAMAMVTEPLFASVANVLGNVDNIAKVPKELKGMEMSLLEVKHGLLQVAESLDFLHNNARLIHRAICPENILITSNGAWKLSGFGFAITTDQASSDSSNVQSFHYAEYDVEDSLFPLQPSLNYTAPELVRSKSSSVGCSSDIFSFACLVYHLVARKPLFDCHNNVKMHMNSLTYLSSESFSSIPSDLTSDLRRMLSANETSRPTASDFTGSPFFRDDTRLRALRFLDHMLARDNMQKSEFLKALSDMWKDFDSRVLRYKVLPPLCAELRNLVMQPMILPMVLTIAESQDRHDFELSTLPALVPVLSSAAGETLLLLVKHAELIINKASQEHLIAHVLPMLVRAYDDTDARMQEEVLKRTVSLAKQLDAQLVRQAILPRVHALALKTTVAAVRVNALLCFSDMVPMLDKRATVEIIQTIQRCTAVDRSAPTLMCTLGVANSILKQHGVDFAVENVLPLLGPLLISQQLNVQQFAKYMLFIKDLLRKVEEKRGVTVTDSGVPEVKIPGAGPNFGPAKNSTGTSMSTTKSTPAWDEEWIPAKESAMSLKTSPTNVSSAKPAIAVANQQPMQINHANLASSVAAASSQPTSESNTSADLEWPPRSYVGVSPPVGSDTDKKTQNGNLSSSTFDDVDPFANWPPRPTSTVGSGSSSHSTIGQSAINPASNWNASTLNGTSSQSYNNSSWTYGTQNAVEPMKQNQMRSTSNSGSLNGNTNSQGSLEFMKSSQPDSARIGAPQKPADIGSIFSSNKGDHSALRLAPPPMTAVGRGRGRGRGNQAQSRANTSSRTATTSSGQPPLLDLL
ncbi:hypothetical protein ACET3Z_003273 [Daucus carota]